MVNFLLTSARDHLAEQTRNTRLLPPGVCGSWPLLAMWDPQFPGLTANPQHTTETSEASGVNSEDVIVQEHVDLRQGQGFRVAEVFSVDSDDLTVWGLVGLRGTLLPRSGRVLAPTGVFEEHYFRAVEASWPQQ